MSGLCIKSDFNDFYDVLSDDNSIITYNRYINNSMQRGSALKYLRSLGIKTLEIGQVNSFFRGDGPIVVYTDPTKHHGTGKSIMTVDEAMNYNGNCVASKYYIDSDMTIKFLQLGKRRFTFYYKRDDGLSLDKGKIIDIRENTQEYNRLFGLPIFSIDYISNGQEMIATDFNEVEKLDSLGVQQFMSAENIITEIIESLRIYNKI